ncbi:MAG: putative sulfate exporter family transporter [Holophagaceae bacterium]|nr:putative sulfate exporter family transporter [Holophagaceae bacterium]
MRTTSAVFLLLGAGLSLVPFTPAAAALVGGAILALSLGNPFQDLVRVWTHRLLPIAVVGLGADMNLRAVAKAGFHGLGYTAIGITLVLAVGWWLVRLMKVESDAGLLISVGTAICGGSAIAAVAPVLRAREDEISVALATIFLLNAVALVIFPPIGHAAALSQDAFGLWSALAIHDTSSVVGAGLAYGPRALEVGTTVKLARALWIVPITLGIGWAVARRSVASLDTPPVKKPWFIGGFLAVAALVTFVPVLHAPGHIIAVAARRVLVLTLFLIGSGLSREALRSVGLRPLMYGLVLWILVGAVSLAAIGSGLIAIH